MIEYSNEMRERMKENKRERERERERKRVKEREREKGGSKTIYIIDISTDCKSQA